MQADFIRQGDTPLFPKILYNRPVTRTAGGRLLVIGGHSGEFSLPTALYQFALAAGIGECQVILPDNLAKLVGGAPGVSFVPSSPSGSLGREALGPILHAAEEFDAVAIGASLSANSHTAILVERLMQELEQPVIIFADALIALQHHVRRFTDRPDCLVIATMPEIFKLAGQLNIPITIRRDGGIINKVEIVQSVAAACKCQLVVYGTEIIIAGQPQAIVTPINYQLSLQPATYYSVLATMWLQNRNQRREGLATGAFILNQVSRPLAAGERTNVAGLTKAISQAFDQAS